jgi:excisionase family DNA binding protein
MGCLSHSMSMETSYPILNPHFIPEEEKREIEQFYEFLRAHPAALVAPDGVEKRIPESVYKLLMQIVQDLNQGRSVAILNTEQELTTAQASNLLAVSRQFLCNLVDRGDIPHHMAGTHRRILARDILEYKAKRDLARHQLLRNMVDSDSGPYEITDEDVRPD